MVLHVPAILGLRQLREKFEFKDRVGHMAIKQNKGILGNPTMNYGGWKDGR